MNRDGALQEAAYSDKIQVNGVTEDKLRFSGGGEASIESSKGLVLRN